MATKDRKPHTISPDTLVTVASRLLALHEKIVAGELTDEEAVISLSDTTGLLVSDIQMYWRTHTLEDSPHHQKLYATIKAPLKR